MSPQLDACQTNMVRLLLKFTVIMQSNQYFRTFDAVTAPPQNAIEKRLTRRSLDKACLMIKPYVQTA
jgi:hypothetical protein